MRKALLCFFVLLSLCACAVKTQPQALDLDLYSDRGFVRRVGEIFADAEPFEGTAIRLTGQYYESGDYAYILRIAPDGTPHGFELVWEGEEPEAGQWILAVGALESYTEGNARYLQVAAQQLYETGRSVEEIPIREEQFLTDLAELYEAADAHLGAQVTLTGRFGTHDTGCYLSRAVEYTDGRTGQVGVEVLSLSALPEPGAWITATGTLGTYERDGEMVLILIDAVLSAAEPQEEPIKEAP